MVDLALLQSVSYIAGALGVCVAAAYYVMMLGEQKRNRKIQLSTSITQTLSTKEFLRDFVAQMSLDWRDTTDWRQRYDSTVNQESYAQRFSIWQSYDTLGYLLREGLVDRKILFNSQGLSAVLIWGRYYPVIEDIRRREIGMRWLENFEYLAKEMWAIGKSNGYASPDYKTGLTFDRYVDVFEPKAIETP